MPNPKAQSSFSKTLQILRSGGLEEASGSKRMGRRKPAGRSKWQRPSETARADAEDAEDSDRVSR